MPIAGVLLAAGRSRRFGGDKRLHPLADGKPMVLRAAQNLAAVCELVVVIRADDEALARMLHAEGLRAVVSERADEGMAHSLAAGVSALPDASAWLIALADMPLITRKSYELVCAALDAGASIARPVFAGRAGHPVGFAAPWFDDLCGLTGDRGAKPIIRRAGDAVVLCDVSDAGVLQDVDTKAQASTLADTCARS